MKTTPSFSPYERVVPMALLSALLLTCLWPVASYAEAPTRFIVKWKDSAVRQQSQALTTTLDAVATRTQHRLQLHRKLDDRVDILQADEPLRADALADTLARLREDTRIAYAVVDERRFAHALTNDTYITATSGRSGQWYLLKNQPASINAFDAWDLSTGGSTGNGIIVAVLDTGIRTDHPDLSGKLVPGYDFVSCDQANCSGTSLTFRTANDGDGWDADPSDPGDWISDSDKQTSFFADCTQGDSSWHGTRVAGLIGAATNNNMGIAGAGWNARVLPVRVLGKCGGYDSDIIAAMKWSAGLPINGVPVNANPARIINLSLGSVGGCSQAYQDAISQVIASGVSVVASAGNDGKIIDTPANCPSVISVVGVRNVGSKVGYSNLGDATIAAPAGNCVNLTGACLYPIDTTTNLGTTTPTFNDYTDQTHANLGTSFSAPLVSGTLALMLGRNANLTPAQLRTRLQATAKPFPSVTSVIACHIPTSSNDVQNAECNCSRSTCGAGLTDAHAAASTVTQPVVAYIRGATAMGVNRTITLDAAGSTLDDSRSNFTWSLTSGSGSLSSTNGSTVAVNSNSTAGSITVSLDIVDGNGNRASRTHTVNVYGPPVAGVVASSRNINAGQSISLDGTSSYAQDSGYLAYAWSATVGNVSNNNGAIATFTAPNTAGTVVVTLRVTDQQGLTASQDVTISVTASSSSSSSVSSAASSSSTSTISASDNGQKGGGAAGEWLFLLLGALAIARRLSMNKA